MFNGRRADGELLQRPSIGHRAAPARSLEDSLWPAGSPYDPAGTYQGVQRTLDPIGELSRDEHLSGDCGREPRKDNPGSVGRLPAFQNRAAGRCTIAEDRCLSPDVRAFPMHIARAKASLLGGYERAGLCRGPGSVHDQRRRPGCRFLGNDICSDSFRRICPDGIEANDQYREELFSVLRDERFWIHENLNRTGATIHQMFGYGREVQGNVKEMCRSDFMLMLMQFDSDKTLGWNFGDAGVLQYWIKPSDLAAHNFDNVVVTIDGS